MKTHLSVVSYEKNSRISFVLDTVCEWYGWNWSYTTPTDPVKGMTLYYGDLTPSGREVLVDRPYPISEIGEPNKKPSWGEYLGVPNPCQADPVSGIFYLLTCAEEYQIQTKDEHDRVPAKELSVVKHGYGGIPLADRLAEVLAKALWQGAGYSGKPQLIPESAYTSLDIDQACAVHYKSVYKKLGNLGREFISRGWRAGRIVLGAIAGARDPFDQFDWLREQHEKRGLKPLVFLLMGYENSTDQAWNPGHEKWPALISRLRDWTNLGVHPSYRTSTDPSLLFEEKERLEKLMDTRIIRSRQHYLKVAWPYTFQYLINAGIEEDYTVGWPDWLGFRMGTARSCNWFDLSTNQKTSLRLFPPTIMEVTGRFYLGLSPKQFLDAASKLKEEAKRSNSGLRVIWHNSTLSEVGGWSEWKLIYPNVLDLVIG